MVVSFLFFSVKDALYSMLEFLDGMDGFCFIMFGCGMKNIMWDIESQYLTTILEHFWYGA